MAAQDSFAPGVALQGVLLNLWGQDLKEPSMMVANKLLGGSSGEYLQKTLTPGGSQAAVPCTLDWSEDPLCWWTAPLPHHCFKDLALSYHAPLKTNTGRA